MSNHYEEWFTKLIASRVEAEGDVTLIEELRETKVKLPEISFISARVIVNGRLTRHRHILFATPADAQRVFDSLFERPGMTDESDEFWKSHGATEVRLCNSESVPPGAEGILPKD